MKERWSKSVTPGVDGIGNVIKDSSNNLANINNLSVGGSVTLSAYSAGILTADENGNITSESSTTGGGSGIWTVPIIDAGDSQGFGVGQIPHYTGYFHAGTSVIIDRLSFRCLTAPGTETCEIGIYNSSYQKMASNTVSVTGAAIYNVSIEAQTLNGGNLYFFALLNTGTTHDLSFACENTDIITGVPNTFQGAATSSLPATESTFNTSNRGVWVAAWKS